jgi:hypothetical protein
MVCLSVVSEMRRVRLRPMASRRSQMSDNCCGVAIRESLLDPLRLVRSGLNWFVLCSYSVLHALQTSKAMKATAHLLPQ